jgi:X-X-X-Leu-X-X-Gly heptad repeat protein
MGKMLLDQEALVKLKKQAGYEDIQGIDQAKQRYLQDVKTYGVEEARRRLGEGELADQMENMSIQERIAIAVEKLAELMENVVGGAKMLAIVLGGIAALRFTGLGNQLLNMTGIMGKLSGGAASAAAGMTRLASGSYVQGGQAFSAAGAPLRGAASSSVLAAAQRQTAGSMTGGMRMPGMGRIAGGLGLGVGAYGLSALQSNLAESGNETGAYAAGLGSSALTGASMGMMFGLPGALIGGALGLGYGLLTSDAPKLASGGIVTKPTLAHVGEGGQAEAVIPLNQLMSKLDKLGENKPANVYLGYHEVGTVMAGGAALTRNTYRI